MAAKKKGREPKEDKDGEHGHAHHLKMAAHHAKMAHHHAQRAHRGARGAARKK